MCRAIRRWQSFDRHRVGRVAGLSRPSSSSLGPRCGCSASPSARSRPRSPPAPPLRGTRETTGTRSVVPGGAAERGERSEALYRAPPAETGDSDTSTVITSEAPPHTSARSGAFLGQPWCRRSALRLDRLRRGAMLPTNLCLLTSTYEKPHPAHHPAWMRRGAAVSRTADPLRRTAHAVCGRASDVSVAPSRLRVFRSRGRRFVRVGLARRRRDRVTDRAGRASRDAFHPARALAPQRPFGRPARTFHPRRGVAASTRASRRLFTPGRDLADLSGAGSPCTRPLPADRASWTSASLADFC
jgi:hypothetical protein